MDSLNLEFVKDKNNILDYNQWSCGDYEREIPYSQSTSNVTIELNDEYKINGNYSIKLLNGQSNSWEWFQIFRYGEYSNISKIQIKLDSISNQKFRIYAICLYNNTTSTTLLDYITALSAETFQTTTLTATVDPMQTVTGVGLRIVLTDKDTVLNMDNVSVKIL